jgi:hypothetical protein
MMEEPPEVTFSFLITTMMMDGMIALGEIEHPVTKTKDLNLPHAQFAIDMLSVLEEKTKNNLTKEEEELLESILYELRMKFVAKNTPKT